MSTFATSEYEQRQRRSRTSADVIMPLALAATGATSIIDVGCGVGVWLAASAALGISDYVGLDGPGAAGALQIPPERFQVTDFTEPFHVGRSFDLVVSAEVAEHLPSQSARPFIQALTHLAPAVLFSAAIPGQGGTRHVNGQWQSYWAALFSECGYLPIDVVRPKVWQHPDVEWWYQQNMLLYLRRDRVPAGYAAPMMIDVVHPALFTERALENNYVSGSRALKVLAASVRRRVQG